METLHNGFTLKLTPNSFPLSTDSIALAGFISIPKKASVLDLGSGCGTLGLLICAQHSDCKVTGIEINPQDHEAALDNAFQNQITGRLNSICADVGNITSFIKPGSFSVCVSNPPYFSSGPKSKAVPLARRDDTLSLDCLFSGAAWALRYGGDFFLVHRPERLAEIFACGAKYHLEPKKLQLLRHKAGGPITLVLVQCRKGGKPGLIWDEQFLYDDQNNHSDYYQKLYHL